MEHLTTNQVARRLNVSAKTVYNWRKWRGLPCIKHDTSRTVRFVVKDVDAWYKEQWRPGDK